MVLDLFLVELEHQCFRGLSTNWCKQWSWQDWVLLPNQKSLQLSHWGPTNSRCTALSKRSSGGLICWLIYYFSSTNIYCQKCRLYRVFFSLGLPSKVQSTEKFIKARLGVSRTIYVNVDSPNLGFPYFNFFRGGPVKKTPCIIGLCNKRKPAFRKKLKKFLAPTIGL